MASREPEDLWDSDIELLDFDFDGDELEDMNSEIDPGADMADSGSDSGGEFADQSDFDEDEDDDERERSDDEGTEPVGDIDVDQDAGNGASQAGDQDNNLFENAGAYDLGFASEDVENLVSDRAFSEFDDDLGSLDEGALRDIGGPPSSDVASMTEIDVGNQLMEAIKGGEAQNLSTDGHSGFTFTESDDKDRDEDASDEDEDDDPRRVGLAKQTPSQHLLGYLRQMWGKALEARKKETKPDTKQLLWGIYTPKEPESKSESIPPFFGYTKMQKTRYVWPKYVQRYDLEEAVFWVMKLSHENPSDGPPLYHSFKYCSLFGRLGVDMNLYMVTPAGVWRLYSQGKRVKDLNWEDEDVKVQLEEYEHLTKALNVDKTEQSLETLRKIYPIFEHISLDSFKTITPQNFGSAAKFFCGFMDKFSLNFYEFVGDQQDDDSGDVKDIHPSVTSLMSDPTGAYTQLRISPKLGNISKPLELFEMKVAGDGDCMWNTLAAGLFGSKSQWPLITKTTELEETLEDRFDELFRQYKQEKDLDDNADFDRHFLKWIIIHHLPLMDPYHIWQFFFQREDSAEREDKTEILKAIQGNTYKRWNAYKEVLVKQGFWGGFAEITVIKHALAPYVEISIIQDINQNNAGQAAVYTTVADGLSHGKAYSVDLRADGKGGFDRYEQVREDHDILPKYESVLFVLRRGDDHYNLLSPTTHRKDFLKRKGNIPEYLYDVS